VYWLPWFVQVLGIPVELLRAAAPRPQVAEPLTTKDALRVATRWLVAEPPAISQIRAGRRIGAGLVSDLEARVHDLRLLDDRLGGADTMIIVERELRAAEAVADEGSYTDPVGRRLFAVIAGLAQLAGWTASDAGRRQRATRLYLRGVQAAHAAGDASAAANLLSSLAYQTANTPGLDPSDAVLLAQTAIAGAQQAPGKVRALLLERLAWSHAKAGAAVETDRALEAVDAAYSDDASGEAEPGWVYWLNRDEIDVMAGRCYVELHRPLRAVPLLTGAINRYPADRAREMGLYLTWLAESYIQANELEAAETTLQRARRLAGTVASERLEVRIRHLTAA
jgi:tetratricopeptide (TPR) repeat protein